MEYKLMKKILTMILCTSLLTSSTLFTQATGSTRIVVGNINKDFEVTVTYILEDGTTIFEPNTITINSNQEVSQVDIPVLQNIPNEGYEVKHVNIIDESSSVVGEFPVAINEGESIEVVLTEINNNPIDISVDNITKTTTLTNWDDRTYEIELNISEAIKSNTILLLDVAKNMNNTFDKSSKDTKWEALEKATSLFIDERSNGSKIGTKIYYDNDEDPKSDTITNLTEDNTLLKSDIDSVIIKSHNNDEPYPSLALNEAIAELIAIKDDGLKNIVLFVGNKMSSEKQDEFIGKSVNVAKKNNINIYIAYLGTETSLPNKYNKWTTGDGKAYKAKDVASLNLMFTNLASDIFNNSIAKSTEKIQVKDVIDPRFELVGDLETIKTELGATSITVTELGTEIIWNLSNADINNETKSWNKKIKIRAKDSFLGGNDIPTNTADSEVVFGTNEPIKFPIPIVDVKTTKQTKTTTLTNWDDRTYEIELNISDIINESITSNTILLLDVSKNMNDTIDSSIKDTKWEVLEKATSSFIDQRTDGSKIGTMTYYEINDIPKSEIITNLTEDNVLLKSSIDNVIVKKSDNDKPYSSKALKEAVDALKAIDDQSEKNIVFFIGNKMDSESQDKLVAEIVKDAKSNKINIHIAYIGEENSIPDKYNQWVTGDGKAYMAETPSDVHKIFNNIASDIFNNIIAKSTANIQVKDVIDPRFELVGDLETIKNELGATSITVTELGTEIIWNLSNTDINNTTNSWNKKIKIRAKDSFFGGNNITTNTADSEFVFGTNEPIKFPIPTVNVKTRFDVLKVTDVIFKGETLQKHLDITDINGIIDLENIKFGEQQFTEYTGKFNIGTIKYSNNNNEVTNETVLNTATKTTYTLTGTYEPAEISNENSDKNSTIDNKVYRVENIEFTGEYIVNVVAGEILINKKLENMSNYDFSNGNPIVTFKIIKDGVTYDYKTISFNEAQKNDTISVTINDLPIGEYKVEELSSSGFTPTLDNSVVSFGACNQLDHTKPETKVFNFSNKYVFDDDDKHSDIVVNSFGVNEDGNITISPSNNVGN